MDTSRLPDEPDAVAPDGSDVRILVSCRGGSMAHFSLGADQTSVAVAHRTLEELWYFVSGRGQMWRSAVEGDAGTVVDVAAGTAISIPSGTHFQFRSFGPGPLTAVGVTMPPWPGIGDLSGRGEVYFPEGPWTATVSAPASSR